MYSVHADHAVVSTGSTPYEAFGIAEKTVFGSKRVYSRYVKEGYQPKPYERMFSVVGPDERLWVATIDVEEEFVHMLREVAAIDDVEEGQARLDALKEKTMRWTSIGRPRMRQLVIEHYSAEKTSVALLKDRLTVVQKHA